MNELANALAASPHSSTPGSRRHWTNQPRQTKQNQNSPIANNYEERSTPSNRHAIFQHHKRRNEFPQIHTRRSYPVSSQWNSIGGEGEGRGGGGRHWLVPMISIQCRPRTILLPYSVTGLEMIINMNKPITIGSDQLG